MPPKSFTITGQIGELYHSVALKLAPYHWSLSKIVADV